MHRGHTLEKQGLPTDVDVESETIFLGSNPPVGQRNLCSHSSRWSISLLTFPNHATLDKLPSPNMAILPVCKIEIIYLPTHIKAGTPWWPIQDNHQVTVGHYWYYEEKWMKFKCELFDSGIDSLCCRGQGGRVEMTLQWQNKGTGRKYPTVSFDCFRGSRWTFVLWEIVPWFKYTQYEILNDHTGQTLLV